MSVYKSIPWKCRKEGNWEQHIGVSIAVIIAFLTVRLVERLIVDPRELICRPTTVALPLLSACHSNFEVVTSFRPSKQSGYFQKSVFITAALL